MTFVSPIPPFLPCRARTFRAPSPFAYLLALAHRLPSVPSSDHPSKMLPMHVADDRPGGGGGGSSSFGRYLSRPRTLVVGFVVVFVLGYFFFSGPGGGGLVPNPGPYAGHIDDLAGNQGHHGGNKPPPPGDLDGHGHGHANANGGHAGAPPPNVNYLDEGETTPDYGAADNTTWGQRAQKVKDAFKFAYGAYAKIAFGRDEILPMSNKPTDNFNGWGVSIVDSLDTMVLMGHKEELARAMEHVAAINISATSQSVHFFETTIRYLGGYLAAYHLVPPGSPESSTLLTQSLHLGSILLRVFETPSGLPGYAAPTKPRPDDKYQSGRSSMYLAEVGSCQVEFKYLAHLTGDARYWKAADGVTRLMHKSQPTSAIKGLWGTNWDINTGEPSQNQFTIGALSDSAYEYILKQYLLSNRSEKYLLDMYIAATDAMIENTLYLSPTRELLYVTDVNTWSGGKVTPSGKLEHLSCFLPGLFALGADQLDASELDEGRRKKHKWVAEGLAYTCYLMYAEQRHGVGPEDVVFKAAESKNWGQVLKDWEATSASKTAGAKPPGVAKLAPAIKDFTKDRDYPAASGDYLLRPETIESVYLLWKTTKDEVWRQRGWQMWEAVDKVTKVENGRQVLSADDLNVTHARSYFFAETLKYYYLLFSNADPWPLNKYIFNTEAHPLPVYTLREWEKRKFEVSAS
ncbi:seven-hairpin glycosidase [Auriculariales sp. MPI-PUGE-AT-0066]|nr:seven-hairpin glycosidase [Auriculariales sp. MPI-PUGE-AT-0066]